MINFPVSCCKSALCGKSAVCLLWWIPWTCWSLYVQLLAIFIITWLSCPIYKIADIDHTGLEPTNCAMMADYQLALWSDYPYLSKHNYMPHLQKPYSRVSFCPGWLNQIPSTCADFLKFRGNVCHIYLPLLFADPPGDLPAVAFLFTRKTCTFPVSVPLPCAYPKHFLTASTPSDISSRL